MKRDFLYFVLLFFVVIGLSVTLYIERKSHKQEVIQLNKERDNWNNVFLELLTIREKEHALLFYDLNTIEVIDKDNNKSLLTALPIQRKLGFYIDQNMCGLCVDRAIENLEKFIEIIGKDNIFIIGSEYRSKYFFSGTPFKDWGSLYLSSDICFSNLQLEAPIFFYVDSNNKIRYSYVEAKNITLDFKSFINKINKI